VGCVGLFFVGCDSGGVSDVNDPPSAKIGIVDIQSQTVTLTADSSEDTDGSIESYEWSFGDGNTDTGPNVEHTYADPGTYTVSLKTTDNAGDSTTTSETLNLVPTTFEVQITNVSSPTPILKSGSTDVNVTGNDDIAGPGEEFTFSFTAGPNEIPGTGMMLSFASMFVQSNDVYYAPEPGGIPLFDDNGTPDNDRDDTPVGLNGSVNVTDQINLYDAGTEGDQPPGTGSDQAPRQTGPDTGPTGEGTIEEVVDNDGDGNPEDGTAIYPAVSDGINVTISSSEDDASGGYEFTVTIENVGSSNEPLLGTNALLVSPGSYAVHWDQTPAGGDVTYPGHSPGSAASLGIERIAEDGLPSGTGDDTDGIDGNHVAALAGATGVTVPLSPGAYAAHSDDIQLFTEDEAASTGVERIAEDGNPGPLVGGIGGSSSITDGGAFTSPDGVTGDASLAPGQSYSFSVDALPGDQLSIGTMYIQSNDAFYAFQPNGIPLWQNGSPVGGDLTGQLRLYDAGTEADEEPGVGLTQAPRQTSADTGPSGEGSVSELTDEDDDGMLEDGSFEYKAPSSVIQVTVSSQP
jgi:PKD repeat protein